MLLAKQAAVSSVMMRKGDQGEAASKTSKPPREAGEPRPPNRSGPEWLEQNENRNVNVNRKNRQVTRYLSDRFVCVATQKVWGSAAPLCL